MTRFGLLLALSALTSVLNAGVCSGIAVTDMPLSHAAVYNIRAFGAKGDGITLDTTAINAAINQASADGGGTVEFPAGDYLSFSVHLKNNITLDLEPGATLIAANPSAGTGYDEAEPNIAAGNFQDFGHDHWHNSLIWGEKLHDIAIVGQGKIFGQGLARDWSQDQSGVGNKSIALKLCRNVTLSDFTISHGGWFGILATGVDNLTVSNLKVDTNRDGMDIDCCRNVHIENCSVNSPNDDGICLKSSFGLGFVRATEDVTITNCEVSGFDEGTFLDATFARTNKNPTGRIKFGTESNGGFKNITVSNCVFDNCRGLALEEVDGGDLEDVSISNITMRDICNAPIFIRLGGRLRGPVGTAMGHVRRIDISHVTVYNSDPSSAILIAGVPDGIIEDVYLSNIHVWSRGGGSAADQSINPPESEKGYPEPGSLGRLPAYGLYARHVSGLSLSDIQLRYIAPDLRPAITLDTVDDASLSHIDASHDSNILPVVTKNVTGFKSDSAN